MWYAVFSRSIVCAIAGVVTLICYLGIRETFFSGPFYLLLPLPILLSIFWHRCDQIFKGPSLKLSLEASLELDKSSSERQNEGKFTAVNTFNRLMFRQPSLVEPQIFPEPYTSIDEIDTQVYVKPSTRKSIDRKTLLLASQSTNTTNSSFRNTYIDNFNCLSTNMDNTSTNNHDVNEILHHPQIVIHNNNNNLRNSLNNPSTHENSPFIEKSNVYC